MKKIVSFILTVFVSAVAIAQETMTFQAEIANKNGNTLSINSGRETVQKIEADAKGNFKATFAVKEGLYQLFDGVEYANLYLKNGYDLKLKLDAKQFDESIKYSGKGELENNFLAQSTIDESTFKYNELLAADEANFNKMVDAKKNSDFQKLDSAKLDSKFESLKHEVTI